MALPAYQARVARGGTPVAVTGEALSFLSGDTYLIDNRDRWIIDPHYNIVINDNGSPVAFTDIGSLDLMFGRVTFKATYTVTGPITMDYRYVPLTIDSEAFSYDLQLGSALHDDTTFDSAHAGAHEGYRKRIAGINDATLSLELKEEIKERWRDSWDGSDTIDASDKKRIFVEIDFNWDSTGLVAHAIARGWFIVDTVGESGSVDGEETTNLNLVAAGIEENRYATPGAIPYSSFFSIRTDAYSETP